MPKIRLAVFDMDGTLLQARSCWAHLHEHFGTDNSKMLRQYIEHKVTDEEFVQADIDLWEKNSNIPVNEEYINSILDEIEPIEGARDLILALHREGIQTAIISGGIQYLADKWAKKWNMKEAIANELTDGDNGRLKFAIGASGHAKGPVMDRLLKKLNMSREEVVAIGDTVVDIPLFERATLGIAVNTDNNKVIEIADYHLKEKDLRNLIPIITDW
ncbi:MAG: HAD family phosphatase [Candidatus Thermoplasmatota archaeon]|nr:HAD family phosphatase [Candidatus Thermoplasmatota archaeon]MEE3242544.1 HAD family phosphatase [Candidatus Thermoplasmatota archaeon]